jgi:hypothetical protein
MIRAVGGTEMTKKQPKTEAELSEAIMTELRKHPECANVERVAIFRSVAQAPYLPNWTFAWVRRGHTRTPIMAGKIAGRMQFEFDLAS